MYEKHLKLFQETDTAQSPYPGWQNVVHSRNVRRNKN
jgi:hypothetical protein